MLCFTLNDVGITFVESLASHSETRPVERVSLFWIPSESAAYDCK